MAKGAQFIEYKGQSIYYVDYSNIKTNEEFMAVIKQSNSFREKVKAQGRKNLLMLVDVSGSFVYGDVLTRSRKPEKSPRK